VNRRLLASLALSAAMAVMTSASRAAAQDAEKPAPALCRALRQMNPEEDLWSYAELAPAPQGGVRRYQIRFASDPEYATGLQRCAELGLAFDEDLETNDQPEFLFHFRAPRASIGLDGVHPTLHVPEGALGALSGALAVRLKMTGGGLILSKELLFASNVGLGEAVLKDIESWFSVAGDAETASFEDVLFLKFDAGRLAMAVEHHHRVRANTA